ncbi:MAG: lactonase family protein [Bryobacteraceae bacterium]
MATAQNWLAYIGTYTKAASKGIYVASYAVETGKLTPIGLAAHSISPSFLAVHPNGKTLYAVNESRRYAGNGNSGSVSAFTINHTTGALTLLNIVPSLGADPCHLTPDHTGRWLFVANYSGGSVAVFPIQEDGSLAESSQLIQHTAFTAADPIRQEAAHVHSVYISPDNKLLYVCDLGADKIVIYNFNVTTGTLSPHKEVMLKPGSGPRHIAFSRDGRFFYSLNELTATVTMFNANLEELQTITTLPKGYKGEKSGAEIEIDPTGRFLYASTRGHDSIAIFTIDAEQGRLTPAGFASSQGKTPRAFAIDPTGSHLIVANQDSQTLVTFKIDPDTGALTTPTSLEVFEPVSILFVK